MKMMQAALAAVLAWGAGGSMAHAQSTVTFPGYFTTRPAISAVVGTEPLLALKSGAVQTLTPYQILSLATGDCSSASPPTIVCTKTGGVPFAASATSDTTNASNIGSGTLNTARLPSPFTSGTRSGNTSAFMTGSGTFNNGHLAGFDVNGNLIDYATRSGNTTVAATVAAGTKTSGHVATWDASGNVQDGGAPGTGTVTEQKETAGYGITQSGNCDNTSTNSASPCNSLVSLTTATNSLGADTSMTSGTITTYFSGPSMAQGTSGTWLATGTVTLQDTTLAAKGNCKLWDGTTVIASAQYTVTGANLPTSLSLSGILATPAGNIRIDCSSNQTTTKILFNGSANSKDSSVSGIRIQ